MADGSKRHSVLDELKAGATIVSEGAEVESESGAVDRAELDPATAFARDPEPVERATGNDADADDDDDRGWLEIDGDADNARPEPGASSAKPRGAGSPNYDRVAAAEKRSATRAAGSTKGNIGLIETLLIGIHSAAAAAIRNPVWELGQEEAHNLAVALAAVQAQYALTLDPKTEAWVKLLGVAGSVYGPRVMVSAMMRKSEQAPIEGAVNTGPETAREAPVERMDLGNGFYRGGPSDPVLPSQIYPPGFRGG